MTVERASPVVLVVEDERDLADLYATWLTENYEVRTAYDAESAVDQMDGDVDVVLLDRRLPGMTGDEFLDHVRGEGYDCQVAMVSAVDPDFDIVEMGFDDYVVKPVTRENLYEVIERLLALETAGRDVQRYFSLMAKKAVLEGEKDRSELAESAEYADLLRDVESFETRVVALAQSYLDGSRSRQSADTAVYREATEEWRNRQRNLDESDPLYRTAEEVIRTYEDELESEPVAETNPRHELLRLASQGFVAEGFWLDESVRRALNEILFEKYSDELVVERRRLVPENALSPRELFDVSQAVRQRAEDELESGA